MKNLLWLLLSLPIFISSTCDFNSRIDRPERNCPPCPPVTQPPTADCQRCVTKDHERGSLSCNEFMVDFSNFGPAAIRRSEQLLQEEGFLKVKECMCGKELQLWQMGPGVDLEDGSQAARDKIGLQGEDFLDFNFELFLGPLPQRGQIQFGDQIRIGPGGGQKPNEVKVAVIDSGADLFHTSLQGVFWQNPTPEQINDDCIKGDYRGYDFQDNDVQPLDPHGHGTHVTGIIARDYPSDIDLQIMPLKFHDGEQGFLFDAVCAIYYAIEKKADVINLSWGFESPKAVPILTRAIKAAHADGIVVVTSAGNNSNNNDTIPHWPSNYKDWVLATANLNAAQSDLVGSSNIGPTLVGLAAPGEHIVSTFPNNEFRILTGTSMAAANVSRVASILKAYSPGSDPADVMNCILSTVTPLGTLSGKVETKGYLNEADALRCPPGSL